MRGLKKSAPAVPGMKWRFLRCVIIRTRFHRTCPSVRRAWGISKSSFWRQSGSEFRASTLFIGKDKTKTIDENFVCVPRGLAAGHSICRSARDRIGIENCPMFFTMDEWPGGNNLASSPAIWEQMFSEIPSAFWPELRSIAPLFAADGLYPAALYFP